MPPRHFDESGLASALRARFSEAIVGYVFGSVATGAAHAASDVDLAGARSVRSVVSTARR